MRLKPEVLKVGDKVRNKVGGDQGTRDPFRDRYARGRARGYPR